MRRLALPLAALVLIVAAVFALTGSWPWQRFDVATPVAVAADSTVTVVKPVDAEYADTLRRGETVSDLFTRHGITLAEIAAIAPALNPRRLRPGLIFHFRAPAEDSVPNRITVRTDPETRLRFSRAAQGWSTQSEAIPWTPETIRIEGTINNSLYDALDSEISDSLLDGAERQRLAWEIADIYRWQIDFTRDLQPGDHFRVLLERLVSGEGEVRFGRVLAADLGLEGKSYTAFRFELASGETAYYDSDANSLQRAFLRAPLEFRRISSNFSRARYHPILGRTRKHEGTDYAAASGTPVMAAGNGTVVRAGRAGGYGNLIELRHINGITTRYGHLRSFAKGIRPGVRVHQGQVIGYVGMTGLATGPHLHYEFRVNGVARDSRRVDLGHGEPLKGADRQRFLVLEQQLAAQLDPPTGAVLAQVQN